MTINSFEFLILNIYMLLAIYLFYFIKLANVSAERLVVARRILYIRGGVLYVTPRRRQTQSRQLLRCAGTYSRGL
uniref:Uncharacterized protein orf74 n=1 Tax=Nyctotherus ovalis TaxID=70075 RepID=F1AAK5_NYCOV|nr:hypothetical protein [Nyctotherus ovalis]